MAEHGPSGGDRRGTRPFVSDAADAPDRQPAVDANADTAIAAEAALKARHPNAGTIPLTKDDGTAPIAGAIKPRND